MDSRLSSSTFISHPLFLPPKIQKSSIFFPKHLSIYRHRPLVLKQREIEVINGSSSPRLFVGVSMLGSPLDHCILGEGASSSKGDFLPNLEEPRMEAIEVSPRKKVERERMSGEGKVVCVTGASGFIASWPAKRLLQRGYTVKATVRDLSDPTSGEGKVVCVTGASGFIASWLAKRLLERGYTVKATVRDLSDPRKTEHLLALDGAKDRLQLFKADLLEEGSFDSVIEGCDGVFHTASPVVFSVTNPQEELIDPALRGTLNVLRSCSKVPSIKRVVFTSSMAAVCHDRKPISPDAVVDETWFSDPDYCEKTEQWYDLSKALAEEAAWNFARENGIDLVTINPGVVIGPLLQPNLNYSVEIILKIIDGTERLENYRFVDIRDVADAHIQAFEIPSASGRYCLVERAVPCSETLQILQELYPSLHFPEKFEDVEWNAKYNVSQEKMKSLGISYIPLETSLKDTIESLKERNLIRI